MTTTPEPADPGRDATIRDLADYFTAVDQYVDATLTPDVLTAQLQQILTAHAGEPAPARDQTTANPPDSC